MNRSVLSFFVPAFLLAGCNNESTKPAEIVQVDSIERTNPAYTRQLISLKNCRNISALLCQHWELKDDRDAIIDNNASMGMLTFRSFYLAVDSTFIKNPRNAMDHGRWVYDDAAKTITLYYRNGGRDVYKIGAIGAGELIVINDGIKSITQLKFVSKGERYTDKMQDPYYIANNQWRIAPVRPESDSLIRKRLKDCLHFYILFYRDNLAKEERSISFYGLPTCLEWYSGGIAMVKEAELADNWVACFYSRTQAMKAYNMMVTVIRKKYLWPEKKEGWLKRNLSILKQMYNNM